MTCPSPTPPKFEHHPNGLGLGIARPRLSWRFITDGTTVPSWTQTAYDVEVLPLSGGKSTVYHREDGQSVLVPWPGEALGSRDAVAVRVRVYGKTSLIGTGFREREASPWSEPALLEIGLLKREDWTADFITSSQVRNAHEPVRPLRFRKDFELPTSKRPIKARLYVTALGVFDVTINGEPVSDECMAPGWTSYNHRLNYRTFDVSRFVSTHKNVIYVELGEGWYAGRLGFNGGKRFCYHGTDIALLAQLEVYQDSSHPYCLISDASWSCMPSAIQSSELYDGEIYDMRQDRSSCGSTNRFVSAKSSYTIRVLPWPQTNLQASQAPAVRITESIAPIDIFKTDKGKTIIDFGQNLVGKLCVKSVQLPEDDSISFTHAEVLEHGELGTRPLRVAKCTDTVISSGAPLKNWSPKFTFHGFRYVQVNGWPSQTTPRKENFVALVMHSDMNRRGHFECSNASVNKLHQNVVWSMRGNFLSIPTDCPQRDERLGWTGDLQVFCPSASFLYDTTGLLGNWLEDVAAEQLEDGKGGIPPLVVPNVLPSNWPHMAQAVWDDVTVLTPNILYLYSGDKNILERQFSSMQAWLDQGVDRGPDGLWNPDKWQLGDWLDPSAPPDDPSYGRTDSILVANAYLLHVTAVFSRICAVLGKNELASKYFADAERFKAIFQYKYITPEGNLMSNSQTGLALAIHFGLYQSPEQLKVAAASLGKLVRSAKFRIATGFAGTPLITHALTSTAQTQLAYRMLLEKNCPSWLYPITMGATTVWERWDSMLPDGTINPGTMTSFNHYALGAVVDWLHTIVGGISPFEPGWKVIRVRPVPGGNLTSAQVSFDGPYGMVQCSWQLVGKEFTMTLTVPPNSTAMVTVPSDLKQSVTSPEERACLVASGTHHFTCVYEPAKWPPTALVAAHKPLPKDDIAI